MPHAFCSTRIHTPQPMRSSAPVTGRSSRWWKCTRIIPASARPRRMSSECRRSSESIGASAPTAVYGADLVDVDMSRTAPRGRAMAADCSSDGYNSNARLAERTRPYFLPRPHPRQLMSDLSRRDLLKAAALASAGIATAGPFSTRSPRTSRPARTPTSRHRRPRTASDARGSVRAARNGARRDRRHRASRTLGAQRIPRHRRRARSSRCATSSPTKRSARRR